MHDSFYEVRSGRSSHGVIPLVYLVRESDGFTVAISPAWSGNWHVDVFSGGRVRAGISTWDFESALTPGESIKAPSVIVSAANNRAIAQKQLQEAVRDHWMARSETTDKIPVEWNHWWPYEDAEINEGVIFENAEIARDMAIDAIVIDAGWFGESNLDTNWTDLRGDWSKVNLARFPSGLEEIGRQINAKGLSSGIWVEIEAVGSKSQLRRELPEAMARDDGGWPDPSYRVGTVSLDADDPGFLGFVCLGSDAGWNYAYQSLTTVLGDINARWLKVDFNIDPGRGCTRTDHGHGPRDGLFRHYEGLYRLLDQVRVDFPELLIEACSSGGLRIDLGLAKHVHCFFLSDPDYTEHHSQVLFGAIQFLPPLAILHWPWSWWRNDYGPSQLDWDKVEPAVFDSMVRSAMFHRLGVSYPLGRLKPVLLQRLNHHLRIFKEQIAPVLKYSTLECLTDSPLRGGRGERWPAWQLSVAVGSKDEIIFISSIAMDLNANPSVFKPRHLLPTLDYIVTDLETGKEIIAKGSEINSQLLSIHAMSLSSWIIKIRPVKGM
jgi:alpha-galactosidase